MKVLLVDDHPLILSALQAVIQGLGDDVPGVGVNTAVRAAASESSRITACPPSVESSRMRIMLVPPSR